MRKIWFFGLVLLTLGSLLFLVPHLPSPFVPAVATLPSPVSPSAASPTPQIQYKAYSLPQAVVHTLLIPAQSRFKVMPALSTGVETLESFVQRHQAIAALNGGFFDPQNQKSTSYIVLQGQRVADPRQNQRLMDNLDLVPYLDKILDRSELRRYHCEHWSYDIARHSQPTPAGCQLVDALGAGPQLLPELTLTPEGFLDTSNPDKVRDALGSRQFNARSAIGITQDGSIIWVMVAQKPELPGSSGLSLPALAEFMKNLGVETALNLDGGSSAALYYDGKTLHGKVDDQGRPIERPVKSVLLLQTN